MSDALQLPPRHDQTLPLSPAASPLASSELASAIVDALADAVVVYDAAGGVVGGNPAAVVLFGLALPSRRATLAVPLEERAAGVDLLTLEGQPLPREEWPAARVLRGETLAGAQTVDVVARTVDGQKRIFNISGAPLRDAHGRMTGAVCVCRDISERKRLEREVAERAAELESIFATQVEGVVYADTASRIVRMNEAQRQLLLARGIDLTAEHIDAWAAETTPRDAQGQPVPRERLPFYRALRGETVAGDEAVELFQRTRDGRDLVVRISASPVRDAQGRILGAVLTTYDVTRQRQLEQQQRDILRVVAHDLLNPITGLRLYFQTQEWRLRQGQPAFVPDEALLNALKTNMTRMERLVNDLRAVTSIEAGALSLDRRPCDLTALCRREVAMQHLLAPERIIQFDAPEEPLLADVDEQRVGQVVANFLSNALKYSPANRPVTLTLSADAVTARIVVQDAGPGIPSAELARLWERFHRVEGIKAQDGTQSLGLGLFICRAIIEQHGGQVGVESAVGQGSTFWCTLPLATPPPPSLSTPTTAEETPSSSPE